MFVKIATYAVNDCTFIVIDRELVTELGWNEFDKVTVTAVGDHITIIRDNDDSTNELRSVGRNLRVIIPKMFDYQPSTRYSQIKTVDGKLTVQLIPDPEVVVLEKPKSLMEGFGQESRHKPSDTSLDDLTEHQLQSQEVVDQLPEHPLEEVEELAQQIKDNIYRLYRNQQVFEVSTLDDEIIPTRVVSDNLMDEATQTLEGRLRGELIGFDEFGREVREQDHNTAIGQLNTLSSTFYKSLDKKIKALCGELPDGANDVCLTPDDIWEGPLKVQGITKYAIDVANPCENYGTMEFHQRRGGEDFKLKFSGVRADKYRGLVQGKMGSILEDWKGGSVWCNPPFSQANWATFAEKAAMEAIGHIDSGRLVKHSDFVFFLMPGMSGHIGNKWEENIYFKEICFEIVLQQPPLFWMVDKWRMAQKIGRADNKKLYIQGINGAIRIFIFSNSPKRKQVINDLITYYEKLNYLFPHKADYYRWLADKTMP